MRGHPGWCLGQKNRLGVPSPSGDSCLDDDPLQGRIHAQAISPDWVGGQPKHLGAVFAVLLAYPRKRLGSFPFDALPVVLPPASMDVGLLLISIGAVNLWRARQSSN